jgi:hypothetical protein
MRNIVSFLRESGCKWFVFLRGLQPVPERIPQRPLDKLARERKPRSKQSSVVAVDEKEEGHHTVSIIFSKQPCLYNYQDLQNETVVTLAKRIDFQFDVKSMTVKVNAT